jgi:hypothetical protein
MYDLLTQQYKLDIYIQMKRWRKIVVFTMILALPISLWASVAMASHCQMPDTSSHSSHMQMDDSDSMQSHDQMQSSESNDQSNCECNDNMDCSVSGCSSTALLNGISIDSNHSTTPVYQRIQAQAEPADPDLLFRPPISIS